MLLCSLSVWSQNVLNTDLNNELTRIDRLYREGKQSEMIGRLYEMKDSIVTTGDFPVVDYISVVNSLVAYLPSVGALKEQDELLDEAIGLCRTHRGAEVYLRYLYASKSQLANSLLDYDGALNWAYRGLELSERENLRDFINVLLLGNAGQSYMAKGDILSAILFTDEAKTLCESDPECLKSEIGRVIYSHLLNNRALMDYNLGRYEQAEEGLRKVLNIDNLQSRPDSPYLFALNNLGMVLLKQGKFEEGLALLEQVPADNYRTAIMKAENALAAHFFLHDNEVVPVLSSYSTVQHQTINNVLNTFSEGEREAFMRQRLRELSTIPNWITLGTLSPEAAAIAFNDNLFARSANTSLTRFVKDELSKNKDLASLRKKAVSKEHSLEIRHEWMNQIKEAENNLLRTIDNIDDIISKEADSFESIRARLAKDEAYVLFVYAPVIESLDTPVPQYGAYVVSANSRSPKLIPLCEVDEVEDIFYNSTPDPEFISNLYSKDKAHQLYKMLWSNLDLELKGYKTIYYSLAGPLSTINFDALVTDSGKRLNQGRNLVLVSSPKYIGTDATITKDLSLAAFGAPDFNLSSETMAVNASSFDCYSGEDISDHLALRGDVLRGNWLDIPGTRKEVEAIAGLITGKGAPTRSYYGADASEEAFKSLNGQSPKVIHIATHGFVITTQAQYDNSAFAQSLSGITERNSYMLWTGLVFAGGNTTWKGEKIPEGVEDGILTADEISQLDLSGTDLVVLSACETARGHIDPVEGVWGLQRAFKDAGVKTILMTLWKVPDTTTAMFMEEFYKQLLKGHTVRKAVRMSQEYLIKNGASDPFYWAPFVVLD